MRFLTLPLVLVSLPLSLHWSSVPVRGQGQIDAGKAQPWTVSTPNGPKTLNAQLMDMKKGYVLLQDSAGKKHSLKHGGGNGPAR
jgi:hypothetical protein